MTDFEPDKRHRKRFGLSSDLRRTLAFLVLGMFGAAPALADGGDDLIGAMAGICVTSLETGAAVGPGLTPAGPAMQAKLLRDKDGVIWRTWSNQVVILAHNSGRTCEVMGLGIMPSEFGTALESWLGAKGAQYTPNKPVDFPNDSNGGIYLATQLEDGGFIQMFIQSLPGAGYLEIIVSRVEDSTEARDVLGL